jgi:pimeloyl-ACP methyl ester carboxylesterase
VDLDLRPRRARLGRRLRRRSLAALVALLALPLITSAAAGDAGSPGSGAGAAKHHCRRLRLPVAVAAGQPASYQVAGTLCSPGSTRGRTLQVLVPGAGVDQHYWDFPYRPERYSYVRAATRAGYATLNIDRLGSGASDYPPAAEVTVASDAFVLHQLLGMVRTGRLAGLGFGQVVTVGFSVGAATVIQEAATYGDPDGVVVTGFIHHVGPLIPSFGSIIHPAEDDPKFAGRDLPDGYVTTRPVARVAFFFNVANVESRVLDVDERLKSTFTPGEGEGFAAVLGDPALSHAIRVPVLVVVGERDGLFCDDPVCSAASSEYQSYSPAAQVQVSVIPAAAHALNLHRNAADVFATIRTWIDTHFRPVSR